MIGSPNDLSGGQIIPIIKSGMTKWVRFRAPGSSQVISPDSSDSTAIKVAIARVGPVPARGSSIARIRLRCARGREPCTGEQAPVF